MTREVRAQFHSLRGTVQQIDRDSQIGRQVREIFKALEPGERITIWLESGEVRSPPSAARKKRRKPPS